MPFPYTFLSVAPPLSLRLHLPGGQEGRETYEANYQGSHKQHFTLRPCYSILLAPSHTKHLLYTHRDKYQHITYACLNLELWPCVCVGVCVCVCNRFHQFRFFNLQNPEYPFVKGVMEEKWPCRKCKYFLKNEGKSMWRVRGKEIK